ncbi:alpha-2-antiplasmin-like [Notolabrus celidotus]|uniref:alpha-2-antiplasmin-like n=1 Tax=Notolabrus celidotus TaxID=1203425 RepID=UPI00148F65F1|nr:alpha-2-antiplasmin-like [Notolabrus celidotus]
MNGLHTRMKRPFNLQTCRNIFTRSGRTDMDEDDDDGPPSTHGLQVHEMHVDCISNSHDTSPCSTPTKPCSPLMCPLGFSGEDQDPQVQASDAGLQSTQPHTYLFAGWAHMATAPCSSFGMARSLKACKVPLPRDEEEMEKDVQNCRGLWLLGPEERRATGGAIERLGLKLLENLPFDPQQPNIILSPLSVALALAQLTLGAQNETEQLLLNGLHADSLPCYHHILGGLLPHFRNTSLEVATRMYLRPGFDVKLSFVEESLARYQSQPVPLVSVEEVNQWVENATNGHIPNFLESIPHDVVLMLMNAVYFKGEWQTRFDPQATSKGVFYLDNQNSVSVDMMKSAQYPLRLLEDPELEAQVASFPFKANTSFLIIMPLPGARNISSVLPKLNISDLYRRLPQEKTMQVNLPKVKLQYRKELEDALTRMGLGSLFSGPNLSGISDHPLKLSSVRHASTVELSEEGVEASATTVITSMRSVSLFSVNSPFLFALVDDASLTPLFMGIVTNPAPDNNPMPNDDPHVGNGTLSDQSATENVESDIFTDSSNRSCSGVEPAEGGILQSCSAPTGDREQHGNGLEKEQR